MASSSTPGMQAMRISVSGRHFGELGTPETLRRRLRGLRAADVAQMAARIVGWLEIPGRDSLGNGQHELARLLFPPPLADAIIERLTLGGQRGGFDALFHPGQLCALQKLAQAVSQPGSPTSFENGARAMDFVAAAAQVCDIRDTLPPSTLAERMDEHEAAIYAFRNAEVNKITGAATVGGRAYQMWFNSTAPWPSRLPDPSDQCLARFGTTLEQFVAIVAAIAVAGLSTREAGRELQPFNPSTYFSTSTVDNSLAASVIASLTFRSTERPRDAISSPATYWCPFDLADRPFVECGNGIVVPVSIRYTLERATTGIFWMMHAANGGEFTTHFGHVFEDYCVRVIQSLAGPLTSVSRELEYGRAQERKKTSDILVTTARINSGGARIFVECRAGRPQREVFATGSLEAFDNYLGDLTGKLCQLDRVITDHQAARFSIDDDLAGPMDPYIPVLVLDTPFQWTFALRNLVEAKLRSHHLFQHPQVTKPILCSIDEFESLVAACERGADLLELLRSYLLSDRMDPLESLLYNKTGLLQPPALAITGWTQLATLVQGELYG
jgi:hypothetical protein